MILPSRLINITAMQTAHLVSVDLSLRKSGNLHGWKILMLDLAIFGFLLHRVNDFVRWVVRVHSLQPRASYQTLREEYGTRLGKNLLGIDSLFLKHR